MMKSPTQSLPEVTFDPIDPNAITVTVEEGPPGYKFLFGNHRYRREQIVVHPRFLKRTGIPRRSQIRLTSTLTGHEAVFTIAQADSIVGDEFTFFCGDDAYERLGLTPGTFTATLDTVIVKGVTEEQAQIDGEIVEGLYDDGIQTDFVIFSYHGGETERLTTVIGERFYDQVVGYGHNPSFYWANGYAQVGYPDNVFNKWHVTSVDIYPPNWPVLNTIVDRNFAKAISFHGFTSTNAIEVGGSAPDIEIDAVVAIIDAAVGPEVTTNNTDLELIQGSAPRNIMNRISPNLDTIQIEMSYDVRVTYGITIADAVAAYYNASIL